MIGLMFYMRPDQELLDVIQWGAQYYRDKYDKEPEVCIVHPSMLTDEKLPDLKMVVRAEKYVLIRNIWIGYEQTKSQED